MLTDQDSKTGAPIRHYTLVKNLGRLFYDTKSGHHNIYPCRYCLHRFYSQLCHDNHILDCGKKDAVAIKFRSGIVKPVTDREIADHESLMNMLENSIANISEATTSERNLVDSLLAMHGSSLDDPPNIIKFKDIIKGFKVPFVLYADFESFISGEEEEHIPSGFSMLRVFAYRDHQTKAYTYSGENVFQNQ
jgi:hypothetical protein